ncbi:transferase [Mucor mucedo]|uniref:transferase n=1 Tax=Mucor mucedo TaxID=29922 RepID=UPI002220DE23|nr:transferase [Mucor mucedo]KAI7888196.1 transferase [Mucor mucedo]
MVAIPPKHRSFLTSPAGIQAKSIPAPEGFSLVTSHVYTKIALFFENVHKDPGFMHWPRLKASLEGALNHYYPLTGRLVKGNNGRYDITNFEKGALFEVADSVDDFQEYKRSNFSYSVVPFEEMIAVQSYVSRDSPLFGAKIVYTRCGSCVLNFSFHHKVMDGWCLTQFLALFARLSRGETIEEDELHMYTDKDRKPVQPLPGLNHAELYPRYAPGEAPPPTIQMGPSKKLIFSFERSVMKKLKASVLEDAGQPKAKLSQFDILSSFVHRAIVKARRAPEDSCADMLCIVSNHHQHPDYDMVKYLGNFIMPVPLHNTAQEVLDKGIFQVATELRAKTRSVTVPFMESLEHYFNTSPNVEEITSPISSLARGAVGFSDWSRFVNNFDLGYGPYVRLRSFVETSPLALITVMPYLPDTIEVIIQLDRRSMDRLVTDRDFMSYVKCIN